MNDARLRLALWMTCGFNLIGAWAFAFPAQLAGQLMGLPTDVPVLYRGLTGMFVLLFAGLYGWLAQQSVIPRPFIAYSAIGKASAFVWFLLLGLTGQMSLLGVLAGSGDLVFAALFLLWLRQTRATA